MAKEIERRFIPQSDFDPASLASETLIIRQSYLPIAGDMILRLRETIKTGVVLRSDHVPEEVEAHIVYDMETKLRETAMTNEGERQELMEGMYRSLRKAAGPEIVKLRHLVMHDGRTWEVDQYVFGDPAIPMIAEIEFDDESEAHLVELPSWAGKEVTGEHQYSNERIAARMSDAVTRTNQ